MSMSMHVWVCVCVYTEMYETYMQYSCVTCKVLPKSPAILKICLKVNLDPYNNPN
jgi:hypothetical protein